MFTNPHKGLSAPALMNATQVNWMWENTPRDRLRALRQDFKEMRHVGRGHAWLFKLIKELSAEPSLAVCTYLVREE
eukprot:1160888-Pelagomonas_calceolata.AAC.3